MKQYSKITYITRKEALVKQGFDYKTALKLAWELTEQAHKNQINKKEEYIFNRLEARNNQH